jgi:hypothetical protein
MHIKHLLISLLYTSSFCALAAPFAISADGQEVTDIKSGLVWRRCAEGMVASGGTCTGVATNFTHEAALNHANDQANSTGFAWRLPNIKELSILVDKSRLDPAIDPVAFPATPSFYFWSSSPWAGVALSAAWSINFGSGHMFSLERNNAPNVRLVRAGQ